MFSLNYLIAFLALGRLDGVGIVARVAKDRCLNAFPGKGSFLPVLLSHATTCLLSYHPI